MNIDWSKVPESATHFDSRQYVLPAFMRKSADGGAWEYLSLSGWKFYGLMHDADVAEMTKRPSDFYCGNLPLIGSTVRIDKGDRIIWDVAEMFIGVDVTLVATFKTGDTQMVAVEHPVEKQCCCFRADMVQTLEQIEAEHRKDTISKMLRYAAITGESFRDVCGKLYDAGLRFEVKP